MFSLLDEESNEVSMLIDFEYLKVSILMMSSPDMLTSSTAFENKYLDS